MIMSKSDAEKIEFILNKHEQAYRRLKPVYTFLEDFSCSSDYIHIIHIRPMLMVVTGRCTDPAE